MKKHTFVEWMIAVRPWSIPASAMPIIVAVAYLFWKGASEYSIINYCEIGRRNEYFIHCKQKVNEIVTQTSF